MGLGRAGRIRCLGDGGDHLVKGSVGGALNMRFDASDD